MQRLSQTWQVVRQRFTDSAFKFESKLRSTLKAMNECTNPHAPNTIIPHLLPFLLLCERDVEDIYSVHTSVRILKLHHLNFICQLFYRKIGNLFLILFFRKILYYNGKAVHLTMVWECYIHT